MKKNKVKALNRYCVVSVACATAGLLGTLSPLVAAQSSSRQATGLEEVIVTARRRDESLANVPIAVTAISAEQLNERQVRTDSDLQLVVPGLTIRQTQGNNSLTYAIRGQSADTFSGSPSAVVAYLNEVPLTISGASTFYDLASVQVLKGPQGTLFGRNTTGGAVLYTAAKPTNETEAMLRLRAGNFDLREVEGMVNVPLIDNTLLFRGAFNSIRKNGYIDNIVTGETHGDIGRDSGRVSLTFSPNDRLENTTLYSYSRTDGTNTGATYVYSIYTAADEARLGRTLNTVSSFIASAVDEQRQIGFYKTQHPYGADHVGEDEIFVNTTTFELRDNLRLKNILGYTVGDTDSEQPALGARFPTFVTRNIDTGKVGNETDVDSLTEELQLTGEAFNGDLNYIVGLYLQQQTADTLWPQTYFGGAVTATNNFRIETDTTALYAQGTYSLMADLRVTAGFRYTKEDISIKQLAESDYYQVPGFAQKQDETFKEPSWEIGLEYDLNESTLTYLKGRHSFRSGGFNGSAPPVDADATGGGNKFDMEKVQDIEAGLKYEGSLLQRPTRFNVAIYKQWVDDVQRIEFPDPPGPVASIAVTANIPEMEVQGFEIESAMMVTDRLELGVAAAYTDADFTDGETTLFGTRYSYGPVANTPEKSWSVWAQADLLRSGELGDVALRVEGYGQDSMYFSNAAYTLTPDTELPSYRLLNARLSWSNIFGSPLSGALFGKNLTDKEYLVGGMPLGASLGHNGAAVGEPRTYGVELTYQFR